MELCSKLFTVILLITAAVSGNPAASSGERLNCVDEPGMTKGVMTDAGGSGSTLNRVDTTLRLKQLRAAMSSAKLVRGKPLKAYIITSDDEHQSEMVSAGDRRREFVTGFTGSAGTAVVTEREAALWTDGRYFIQADQQLDCQWSIMKTGLDNVPTVSEWLRKSLRAGDRVGADPKLVSADQWLEWRSDLADGGIQLDAVATNLVDNIWADAKPKPDPRPIYIHDITFAGQSWQDKVKAIRTELRELNVDGIVITALDEIAWLLNLRGNDIAYSPVFKSYVYVSQSQVVLFVDQNKFKLANTKIRRHLSELNTDNCKGNGRELCVDIRRYENVFTDLPKLVVNANAVLLPSRYAYSGGVSFAISETIPVDKRRSAPSPLILLKAQKNPVEVEGMKNAHLKDAVALCDFLSLLQEEIGEGKSDEKWDELRVSTVLNEYRMQQENCQGPSFETIAGFGPNGAVIHYRPSVKTNRAVDNSSLLLIDSGGQYFDGTTDVTRTFHFGRPSQRQKELYTRVLMGVIDLASLVFPESTDDTRIDIIARQHLYQAGLDYSHGTGHGIGSFLNVHESPSQIRIYGKVGHRFEENYFLSDEPGYYQENEFGIRLESILRVVRKSFEKDKESKYLGFEIVTQVPFEQNLIVPEMMTFKQLHWLNHYHASVRTKVGETLKKQNKMRAFRWLMTRTRHISEPCHRASSQPGGPSPSPILTQIIFSTIAQILLVAILPIGLL